MLKVFRVAWEGGTETETVRDPIELVRASSFPRKYLEGGRAVWRIPLSSPRNQSNLRSSVHSYLRSCSKSAIAVDQGARVVHPIANRLRRICINAKSQPKSFVTWTCY